MSLRCSTLLACAGVLVASTRAHAAPARAFDIVNFAPPDGFAVDDKSADHLSLTDTAPGRFGVIAVYTGRPASGDLAADFKTQWHDAVEHMMQPDATPDPVRGTMPGGLGLEVGSATAKMDGKDVYARLFVIDGGAKVAAVLVVTPGADIYDRYENAINAMLASMTVTKTVVPATPPAPPKPPAAPAPAPAPAGGAVKPPAAPAAPAKPAMPPPPPPPPPYKAVALPDDPALPDAPKIDKKQLVGDWQHSTGRAADKASAIYGDVYSLTSRNKYDTRFIGKTGADVLRESDDGGYAYKDGRLLLLGNKRGTVVLRVVGWTDDKAATTLSFLPDGLPATEGNATIFGQAWTRAKGHAKTKH